jgi:hypothetical protein
MKTILAALLLFVSTALTVVADMTNGVFYLDNAVECHLISQNGAVRTNHLIAGKTYMVDDVLVELESTNRTQYYLAGGPTIEASSQYLFSINLFDQEVKNLNVQPQKAEFGTHNIAVNLTKGDFAILYPSTNAENSFVVSTPYAAYQLHGGRYFFRVTEKSTVAFVLDGMLTVHGDKNKTEKTEKGKMSVVVPFTDPLSGVDDKVVTSIKSLKQEEVERFGAPILSAEKRVINVQFVVVYGRVVGIYLK